MKLSFTKILLGSFALLSCFFIEGNALSSKNLSQLKLENSKITEENEVKDVVLYIKETCPYCKKVMQALDHMGKSVTVKDISKNEELREELIKIGGKKQVPCIVIKGKPKYESSDIITWLSKNKDLL